MTSRDFCYWLQGFFEISGAKVITAEQAGVIRNHLNMVFVHEIDPSHGDAAHQAELAKAHEGKLSPPLKKPSSGGDSGYRRPPKAMC